MAEYRIVNEFGEHTVQWKTKWWPFWRKIKWAFTKGSFNTFPEAREVAEHHAQGHRCWGDVTRKVTYLGELPNEETIRIVK